MSATAPGPVPTRAGSATRGRGRGYFSGSHHSQEQRARRARWFTHRTPSHRCRTLTRMYGNSRGGGRESYSDLWRARRISSASAPLLLILPSILEPERMLDKKLYSKQRYVRTRFVRFEQTCPDHSLVVEALAWKDMGCMHTPC